MRNTADTAFKILTAGMAAASIWAVAAPRATAQDSNDGPPFAPNTHPVSIAPMKDMTLHYVGTTDDGTKITMQCAWKVGEDGNPAADDSYRSQSEYKDGQTTGLEFMDGTFLAMQGLKRNGTSYPVYDLRAQAFVPEMPASKLVQCASHDDLYQDLSECSAISTDHARFDRSTPGHTRFSGSFISTDRLLRIDRDNAQRCSSMVNFAAAKSMIAPSQWSAEAANGRTARIQKRFSFVMNTVR